MSSLKSLAPIIPPPAVKFFVLFLQAVGDSCSLCLARRKRELDFIDRGTHVVRFMDSNPKRNDSRGLAWKIQTFGTVFFLSLYKVYKRILHYLWGGCTIDRICKLGNSEDRRAALANAAAYHRLLTRRAVWLVDLEFILSDELFEERQTIDQYSHSPAVLDGDDLAKTLTLSVCRLKGMDITKPASKFLEKSVRQILLIERLRVELMDLSREKVEWNDANKQLTEIWSVLHGHSYWPSSANTAAVSRRSRGGHNWVTLGFQGVDPSDDFRGTGKLGLHFFHHMCLHHTGHMARIIVQSRSPEIHLDTLRTPWYPAALVSIHITSFIARLVYTGELRLWIICSMQSNSTSEDLWDLLANLHSYVYMEFHRFWQNEVRKRTVRTIMDFDKCFASFTHKMEVVVQKRPFMWSSIYPIFAEFPNLYYYFYRREYVFASLPYGKSEFAYHFDFVELKDRREVERVEAEEKMLAEYELDDLSSTELVATKSAPAYTDRTGTKSKKE
ncbi:ELMO/CED-12 family-domain-containing protein [Lipomyces arxii]|uniref:ELMO/CED-12 family-domain-containing protein n=1 Tax=Lipomyces arxii TaxID=56418 RepID=UPI0034D015EB